MTTVLGMAAMLVTALLGPAPAQAPFEVTIMSPAADALLVGTSVIDAAVSPADAAVQTMAFYVDGRLACTRTEAPWRCEFEGGVVPTQRHLRVVARAASGRRAVANLRTQAVGFTESVRVSAVQVPVIVRDGRGRLLRGLKPEQFSLKEDGVLQDIVTVVHEDVPLDLVLALDMSASMEGVLADVLEAGTRFLSKLHARDAATILAFNDNTFVVVDRETDPARRQLTSMDLTAWGGTALYDATLEALTLAERSTGRKGVVVFTDGEDRMSRTNSTNTARRIQGSDVLVYTIAFGAGAADPEMRRQLELHARMSGGRVFFVRSTEELGGAFDEIITELTGQYVLSYEPRKSGAGWRRLEVLVSQRGAKVQAREGYLAAAR